jgi:hypothetical protein
VTLFMTLPAPVSALDAWDAMLATAGASASCSKPKCWMTPAACSPASAIAQIREEMREYDRRHGLGKNERVVMSEPDGGRAAAAGRATAGESTAQLPLLRARRAGRVRRRVRPPAARA